MLNSPPSRGGRGAGVPIDWCIMSCSFKKAMFYPEIYKVNKLQLKRYHYLTLKYLLCNACMHLYFVVPTKALARYKPIKQPGKLKFIILTSNNQRLRSAGDNDRGSKLLCVLSFTWETRNQITASLSPDKTKESAVSYFFFPGLRPRFSRLAALPLACLDLACGNFAKKNKRLLAVYFQVFFFL